LTVIGGEGGDDSISIPRYFLKPMLCSLRAKGLVSG
jgi:hypothetical protein